MKRIALYFITILLFLLTACGTTDTSEEVNLNEQEPNVPVETKAATGEEREKEENQEDEKEKEKETEKEKEETAEEVAEAENHETADAAPVYEGQLQVHFIDVGQADATLLQYTDEESEYTILFDTGDWRGSQVVSYLRSNDISDLDLVVISHPDADHIGQLEDVMQHLNVGEVWMPGNESSSQTFQRAVEAVIASESDYNEPRAGDTYDIGPIALDVLHPASISGKVNEESLAVLFTFGSMKLLFTGDADQNAETEMRNNFDVSADILHLGHHGSNTSTHPAFVDAVAPSIAVYSAGENNSYGHPSPEVISTVLEREITLYGTDEHGTIIITIKSDKIDQIETGVNTIPIKEIEKTAASDTDKNETTTKEKETEAETNSAESTGCININKASIDELMEIIHIGDVRAEELVNLRPFSSVAGMERINGIGPARIADIKTEGKACTE